jgi:hypothetical protein
MRHPSPPPFSSHQVSREDKPSRLYRIWFALLLLAVLGTMVLAFSPMPANSAGTGSVSNAGGAGNAGKAGIPDASIGKPPKAPYPMRSNQHWNTPGEIGAWQRQRKWRHPEAWAGHES